MIKLLIDKNLDDNFDKIHYCLNFIFESIGCHATIIKTMDEINKKDIVICYTKKLLGQKEKFQLIEMSDSKNILFISAYIPLYNSIMLNKKSLMKLKKEYHSIYVLSEKIPSVKKQKSDYTSTINYNFDIIGNIYFHLSQSENKILLAKNKFEDKNLLFFNELKEFPFLNKLIKLFELDIISSLPKDCFFVKKHLWPKGEDYAMCISATVNKLYKFKNSFKELFKIFFMFFVSPAKAIKQYFNYLFSKYEEYWNFYLFKNLLITYFFGLGDDKNLDYSIKDEEIVKIIEELSLSDNHDISIFLDKKSDYILDKRDIKNSEKNKLNIGGMGLRTEKLGTGSFFEDFLYCQGRGFQKNNGFKSGIALPYFNYSLNKSRKQILMIPDIFNTQNLRKSTFSSQSYSKVLKSFETIVANIKKTNGIVCFNFNFSDLYEIGYSKKLLTKCVEQNKKDNIFFNTIKGLTSWWLQRDELNVRELYDAVEIISPKFVKNVCFEIFGNYRIKKITGCRGSITENKVVLSNVKRYAKIVIHLKKQIKSEIKKNTIVA